MPSRAVLKVAARHETRCESPITCHCSLESKRGAIQRVKDREIIADDLSKAGRSWGCVSAVGSRGRPIWIADAYRGDGQRFAVRAGENYRLESGDSRLTREGGGHIAFARK